MPVIVQTISVQAASPATPTFASAAQNAATSTHVPLALIEATAYVNTRWEWISTPSISGGVGPMNVTSDQIPLAASLSGHDASAIKTDLTANLTAGAALLAHYHASGSDLASWSSAVGTTQGPYVVGQIYAVLRTGASRTLSTGETVTMAPQTVGSPSAAQSVSGAATSDATSAAAAACSATSPDFGAPACWIPAYDGNYSFADRGHDYPVDMIIIHDIEGSYGSAIQVFQRPGFDASAHYVVSYGGDITQMVHEQDIAWHAGNWDYNTRAIGIEHEGFAWTPGLYTTAEYNASAQIAASICSKWGVPLDRNHVIGHNEVPDPNNPGQFGGANHHTDPGPYWNWTYYVQQAQADAATLPSPPHLMPDPTASNTTDTSATVTWTPARTCRAVAVPITGYTVVMQPGSVTQTLPAGATSATFKALKFGTTYSFTVTATNADGQDSARSNPIKAGVPAFKAPGWTSLGGVLTSAPDAASGGATSLDVFARGTDNGLWRWSWNGSATTIWQSLAGGVSADPAATAQGTRSDVFVRGTDNQLWVRMATAGVFGGWQPLGGILSSGPDADSWTGPSLHEDVFARGTDGQLWHRAGDNGSWSQWEPLGGQLTSDPGAVSWGPDRVDVFVRGTDNQLWHRWYSAGAWYAWEPLGGVLASAPDAASCTGGHLDVFVVGTDGQLWQKGFNGTSWTNWQRLGGRWTSSPSAVCPPTTGLVDLFVRGRDNALWHNAVRGS